MRISTILCVVTFLSMNSALQVGDDENFENTLQSFLSSNQNRIKRSPNEADKNSSSEVHEKVPIHVHPDTDDHGAEPENNLKGHGQEQGKSHGQEHGQENGQGHEDSGHHGIKVASWRWDHVGEYIAITVFLVISGLLKVGFHHAHFISSRVPESCLLFITGCFFGWLIVYLDSYHAFELPRFTPTLFFFFLLPPIILDASYSLYDEAFFGNIFTILIMAIVGTFFNFVLIGGLLILVYQIGIMGSVTLPFTVGQDVSTTGEVYNLGAMEVMVFASLISAVDPVAVLAIFEEVGVNPDLYFLLFGESLLNDGVAVVFYNMMNAFAVIVSQGESIPAEQWVLGVVSFFTVAFGGLIVGMIVGVLTALITKATSQVRVVEPLAVLAMAYFAYIAAELFHWSGIISMIGCGLVQAHYAFKNISKKSNTTVKYFIKMMSSTCDCLIFLYLGISFVEGPHYWHFGYILWTLGFCLVIRFLGVYGLVWIVNRRRVKKISFREQFIMAYGGLRGAVGFSLVKSIDEASVPPKNMFLTTTLIVIIFTIFLQGGTIKLLVNLLHIDKKSEEQRLISQELNEDVMDNIMAGIEVIAGGRGQLYIGKVMERFDEKYLQKWFCKQDRHSTLRTLFEELALSDHLCNLYGPAMMMSEGTPEVLLETFDFEEDTDNILYRGNQTRSPSFYSMGRRMSRRPSRIAEFLRSGSVSLAMSRRPSNGDIESVDSSRRSSNDDRRTNRRKSRISEFLRNGSISSSRRESEANSDELSRRSSNAEVRESLRSALAKSPFVKYHQRYNPNLIADDYQEMDSHLRRRHLNARRMSQVLVDRMNSLGGEEEQGEKEEGEKQRPMSAGPPVRRNEAWDRSSLQVVPENERSKVEAIMQNYQRRRAQSMSAASRKGLAAAKGQGSESPKHLHTFGSSPNPFLRRFNLVEVNPMKDVYRGQGDLRNDSIFQRVPEKERPRVAAILKNYERRRAMSLCQESEHMPPPKHPLHTKRQTSLAPHHLTRRDPNRGSGRSARSSRRPSLNPPIIEGTEEDKGDSSDSPT